MGTDAMIFWYALDGCLLLIAVYSGYRMFKRYSGRARVVGLTLTTCVYGLTLLVAPLFSAVVIGTTLGIFIGHQISLALASTTAMLVAFLLATGLSALCHVASRWSMRRFAIRSTD